MVGDVESVRARTCCSQEVDLKTEHRELLRRLTLNDEMTVGDVLAGRVPSSDTLLDDKTRALVKLAGLVALDSETASLQAIIDVARGAGALDEEIVETVIAVAPVVGLSRISSALPRLAAVLEQS